MKNTTRLSILLPTLLAFLLVTGCASPTPALQSSFEPTQAGDGAVVPSVYAEGILLPRQTVELAFAQSGIIREVAAGPGDMLKPGDLIARLDGIEMVQAELAAAQLDRILARQDLDTLHRGALQSTAQAEASLRAAEDTLIDLTQRWQLGNEEEATDLEFNLDDYIQVEQSVREAREKLDDLSGKEDADRERRDAQKDLEREQTSLAEAYTDLQSSVAENDQPLEKNQIDILAAAAGLEMARDVLDRQNSQNLDPDDLAIAEGRLDAAEAHIAALEGALDNLEIRAPIGGSLFSLDLVVGETAQAGVPVVYLADPSDWVVKTVDLAEIDINRVSPGQTAVIKLDAFPGEEFSGRVVSIDPVGVDYLGDMTYEVTLSMDDADPRFLWNMTAVVSIQTK